jgi:hypothetical protein
MVESSPENNDSRKGRPLAKAIASDKSFLVADAEKQKATIRDEDEIKKPAKKSRINRGGASQARENGNSTHRAKLSEQVKKSRECFATFSNSSVAVSPERHESFPRERVEKSQRNVAS